MMLWVVAAAVVWYVLASLVTFAAFWLDKKKAELGARRIPERTLHVLSLAGGFAGALGAMAWVRHKNRKVRFVAVTVGCAAVHGVVWAGVIVGILLLRR